jgi:hypothetical protein
MGVVYNAIFVIISQYNILDNVYQYILCILSLGTSGSVHKRKMISLFKYIYILISPEKFTLDILY